jgi:hypothetical protein
MRRFDVMSYPSLVRKLGIGSLLLGLPAVAGEGFRSS